MSNYGEEGELFAIKNAVGDRIYLEMPFQAVTVTGLDFPPIGRRTVRSPFQHGETYLGFSLLPRPVQFAVHSRGCNRLNMWALRRQMVNLLNPLIGTLRIRVQFRDGAIYELHGVVPDALIDWDVSYRTEPSVQPMGMRFIAYDPAWKAYPENSFTAVIVVSDELTFHIREEPPWGTGIEFPIEFPIEFVEPGPPPFLGTGIIFPIIFGSTMILESVDIITAGSWITYPTFVLTGPLRNPVIRNNTTEEMLELQYKIKNGEVVTITTEFGRKSITNNADENLLGYLTPDSDLATFHLDPDPLASGGVNNIGLEALECTPNSAMSIHWFDRYLGI